MKNLFFILILNLCLQSSLFAQALTTTDSMIKKDTIFNTKSSSKFELSVSLGVGFISGDAELKPGEIFGITLIKPLKSGFSIALDITQGLLFINPKKNYTYTGQTSMLQITPLLRKDILFKKQNIEIIPFLGVGYVSYKPTNSIDGKVIRYAAGSANNPSPVGDLVIPFGIELGKILKNKNKVGIILSSSYVNSDRFDGIVGTTGIDRVNRQPHLYQGLIVDYSSENNGSKNDFWGGLKLYYKINFGAKKQMRLQ